MKAAECKNDERLLLQIRGKDLVAIELKYHPSCHKDYTRVLSKNRRPQRLKTGDSVYESESFKTFCELVEDKLLKQGEILRMTKLKEIFIEILDKNNMTFSEIRTAYLKKKISNLYPQLQFVKPSNRTLSEIVYVENNENALADHWESQDSQSQLSEDHDEIDEIIEEGATAVSEDETSDAFEGETSAAFNSQLGTVIEEESDSIFEGAYHPSTEIETPSATIKEKSVFDQQIARELYMSALQLRNVLRDCDNSSVWPPTNAHLTSEHAKQIVPVPLYNMLAWVVGVSDEFCVEKFVESSDENNRKLVSISQDILYLSSKGRIQTPKHLALGMTIRHWTGSSTLISLLNGFGHSVSHSTVLEHDSALASMELGKKMYSSCWI